VDISEAGAIGIPVLATVMGGSFVPNLRAGSKVTPVSGQQVIFVFVAGKPTYKVPCSFRQQSSPDEISQDSASLVDTDV
jgi:hypothetical protein